MARAAMTSLHHPMGREAFVNQYGIGPIANATLGLISVSIIYSYLAIESFINAQLYSVWKRRHDGSQESIRFLSLLGDVEKFEALKNVKDVRYLGERMKYLCQILGFKKPHEINDTLWQDFKNLVEISRHFLVHPFPDTEYFHNNISRIMTETKAGKYSNIASSLIGHFYDEAGKTRPPWLSENTLYCLGGLKLLVDK